MPNANFIVRGEYYHSKDIESIGIKNPDYSMKKDDFIEKHRVGEKVLKYTFDITSVELVPEPDNPHDRDAIKVIMNGVHVGYVRKENTDGARKYIGSRDVIGISGTIKDGPYKIIVSDNDGNKKVVTRKENYVAKFTVRTKEKEQIIEKKKDVPRKGSCLPVFLLMLVVPASVIYSIIRLIK